MIPHYQIPRNTLLWLFATQVLVLLPHIQRTPIWISVLLFVCMLWRIQVFRGHWPFPKKIIKVPLTLASCAGLVLSFPSFFGLEALVSVLLVAYGLKLLEMYHKRDALILLYLSFFLATTGFLFDQSILLALFNMVVLCVLVTALKGLYQLYGDSNFVRSFRHSTVMVLQALPLMVLMFVLLPRFPSFWNVPLNKHTAKTGMSDSMSPGDYSRLAQNNDPVMRIAFRSKTPESRDLYWRGLTFSKFDGRRWQVDDMLYGKPGDFVTAYKLSDDRSTFLKRIQNFGLYGEERNTDGSSNAIRYEVILEETETQWLYALKNSIPDTPDIWVTYDQLLAKNGFVNSRFRYEVSSYPADQRYIDLPEWQRKIQTRLPNDFNPRSRERAGLWLIESGSSEQYIEKLLSWYQDEFFYTLQPPALGKNSIDEFLFGTKKGFCEHFASSFVFMLRAAGIPSRVVVGYQGGEWNPYENYLLVRQYDAHAWAEVWLDGKGWVRFDPTFAVAPQRILDGFRDTFENKDELELSVLSLDRYRNFALLNALRLQWDSVNYNWARWVLGYDSERQLDFLNNMFGEYSAIRVALIFGGITALFLASIYLFLLWQERDKTSDPVVKQYRKFCRKMKSKGLELQSGETPHAFLRRVAKENPDRYSHLEIVSQSLYHYWYNVSENDQSIIDLLRK